MKSLEKILGYGAVTLFSFSGCIQAPSDTGVFEDVVIYPSSPRPSQDIHCRVDYLEETVFDFYWLLNREFVSFQPQQNTGLLEKGLVRRGDYVECSVWMPSSASYDSFELGSEGVYVE